jgi:hypothetical protein
MYGENEGSILTDWLQNNEGVAISLSCRTGSLGSLFYGMKAQYVTENEAILKEGDNDKKQKQL